MPAPRLLILETSGSRGQVACLPRVPKLLALRQLDEGRRQARDLAPAVAQLLEQQQWRPRAVDAVLVSLGPGSYTGLRVGVMSAKTFAFATGCAIFGLETFQAIAHQCPSNVQQIDVLADAQKNQIYQQSFFARATTGEPLSELTIRPFADWLVQRSTNSWVSGPGLRKWRALTCQAMLPSSMNCIGSRVPRACCSLAWLVCQRAVTMSCHWNRCTCGRVPRRNSGGREVVRLVERSDDC